jgi:hypothetical protein
LLIEEIFRRIYMLHMFRSYDLKHNNTYSVMNLSTVIGSVFFFNLFNCKKHLKYILFLKMFERTSLFTNLNMFQVTPINYPFQTYTLLLLKQSGKIEAIIKSCMHQSDASNKHTASLTLCTTPIWCQLTTLIPPFSFFCYFFGF